MYIRSFTPASLEGEGWSRPVDHSCLVEPWVVVWCGWWMRTTFGTGPRLAHPAPVAPDSPLPNPYAVPVERERKIYDLLMTFHQCEMRYLRKE